MLSRGEVRQFGIRVMLVEPAATRTSLDANSPQAASPISAYDAERDSATKAILKNMGSALEPDGVADTIVDAVFAAWRMRRPPKGQAALLCKLRRFMFAGAVDSALRKDFGLG